MATFKQLPSGNWRVQIRRKGRYASQTFRRYKDAEEWALDSERRIDRGEEVFPQGKRDPRTFGDLVDLHIADMTEVGKTPRRSKSLTLNSLKAGLGSIRLADLTRERLIRFGKDRACAGAGPVTLGMDLGYVRTVIVHAAAVHGVRISVEPVELARVALRRLGLVGKSSQRDRRPTKSEITRIVDYLDMNARQIIPMGRIVLFAIASGMREEEICRIVWDDVDRETRTAVVRDRKDPRNKDGNDQKVPLLRVGDLDAWALLMSQHNITGGRGRVFPYNSRSVGTAFRRACRKLKIQDLHFHDLRHEATSRLFEVGLSIQQVALVTGHKDWKMLRRYTHLRPEQLHDVIADLDRRVAGNFR